MYLRRKYAFADGQDSLKAVAQYVSETFYFCSEMSRLTTWEDFICRELLKKKSDTRKKHVTQGIFFSVQNIMEII